MTTADIALVTGGNKGLGLEIVRQLAERGMRVYLGARDETRGREAVAGLTTSGDVRFVQLDVTDRESVRAAVALIDAESGRLDVLVNNAGISSEVGTAVPDITADQMRATFEVNVFGVVTVTSACIPLLRKSANGRIVNMASRLGSLTALSAPDSRQRKLGALTYSSSKAALNVLTLLYSEALRADGIQVNSVTPGRVDTGIGAGTDRSTDRTLADGVRTPIHLATLPPQTMTGEFRGSGIDESPGW
ncbi:MAG: SDR family NAD(P)-dependent oxidoreductase [Propionibacteriaceae bacterium]|jgi:NAD(P)-dependent dehydrogenase (short-subunit alcohol dehydrogenase family)|nr:SDR family NAD(P)-dependent oxidoreductase [Propionibacteriaceae bacterium]